MTGRIAARLAQQSGLATPVVVAIMAVVSLLAAGGALAALGTNDGANEDRRAKRALAAAEAGVQEAAYRLATVRPDPDGCLGANGTAVGTGTGDAAPGECPAVPGLVTSDATFTYTATPKLASGAACADRPNLDADPTATDHCITATGTVAGVKRRLQARVRVTRTTIFGVIGLLGLDSVTIENSGKVWSDVGSNGLVRGGNSTELYGDVMVPNSAPTPTISGTPQPDVVRTSDPWALAQTDFAPVAASNNNAALPAALGTSWNATTREAVLTGRSYTLPAGTYLMCELWVDQGVDFFLSGATATNPVRIFIDSPDRPGSNCAPERGRLCMDNSIKFNRPGDAAALEVYVYGSAAHCEAGRLGMPFQASSYRTDATVVLNNSVDFNGTIYAPNSTVRLNNSIRMDGGIAARDIFLENSVDFVNDASVRDKVPAAGPVRRLSWVECSSRPPSAANPESGCA
jgi:type II secretory pathway pseudopilin PulG